MGNFRAYLELVGPAYRHLGLNAAAEAFDRFVASPPAQRLLNDPELIPSERELRELSRLFDEIGEHDADRIAFVRARPQVFSI